MNEAQTKAGARMLTHLLPSDDSTLIV